MGVFWSSSFSQHRIYILSPETLFNMTYLPSTYFSLVFFKLIVLFAHPSQKPNESQPTANYSENTYTPIPNKKNLTRLVENLNAVPFQRLSDPTQHGSFYTTTIHTIVTHIRIRQCHQTHFVPIQTAKIRDVDFFGLHIVAWYTQIYSHAFLNAYLTGDGA